MRASPAYGFAYGLVLLAMSLPGWTLRGREITPAGRNDMASSEKIEPRVLLDCYYNNEWRKNLAGEPVRFHYTWDDTTDSGFSQLASIIAGLGCIVDTLSHQPTIDALKPATMYIIVDPDTPKESPDPRYIESQDIETIVTWVKGGGILILLGNDKGNAEFGHLNDLARHFGIHFNEDSRNRVVGRHFETGTFTRFPDHPLFQGVTKIYLKELSTLHLRKPATAVYTDSGNTIMAYAHVGRGRVFAVGDPWFYNEYMDQRRLPAGYDNARAAENLFTWLLKERFQGREKKTK